MSKIKKKYALPDLKNKDIEYILSTAIEHTLVDSAVTKIWLYINNLEKKNEGEKKNVVYSKS